MSSVPTFDGSNAVSTAARHKFTVADLHRMLDAGIFEEDDRIELIRGELFNMAPIGSRHAATVNILGKRLTLGARDRCLVSIQNPVQFPDDSEPLPDLALLKPRSDSYREALPQPADVFLIVEVSDSTLSYDRDVKIPIYAARLIPETWLVDLQRRTVTVFRKPDADGYRETTEIAAGFLSPECLPDLVVEVSELFG